MEVSNLARDMEDGNQAQSQVLMGPDSPDFVDGPSMGSKESAASKASMESMKSMEPIGRQSKSFVRPPMFGVLAWVLAATFIAAGFVFALGPTRGTVKLVENKAVPSSPTKIGGAATGVNAAVRNSSDSKNSQSTSTIAPNPTQTTSTVLQSQTNANPASGTNGDPTAAQSPSPSSPAATSTNSATRNQTNDGAPNADRRIVSDTSTSMVTSIPTPTAPPATTAPSTTPVPPTTVSVSTTEMQNVKAQGIGLWRGRPA